MIKSDIDKAPEWISNAPCGTNISQSSKARNELSTSYIYYVFLDVWLFVKIWELLDMFWPFVLLFDNDVIDRYCSRDG